MGFNITGDLATGKALDDSPFALLTAVMLDQQYPIDNHGFRVIRKAESV